MPIRSILRVFMDTNGDGIGDLRGVISKLDYLKELGVDIIWLSPIYQSPFVDQGYDISDYYKIAEEFGTMEEFDELLAETKKRDMYVLLSNVGTEDVRGQEIAETGAVTLESCEAVVLLLG